jgi:hypothetical protein
VDIINEAGSLGSGLDREAGAGPDSLDGDIGAMPCVESVEQCGTGLIHLLGYDCIPYKSRDDCDLPPTEAFWVQSG